MSDTDDGKFEVDDDFAFLGRTFAEYRRMFDLDVANLQGKAVLDCPGGPGSFTAVASELAASIVAVDPVYGPPVDELEGLCRRSVAENVAQLQQKKDLFVWEHYRDVETRGRFQRAAAERFLADYAQHRGRYLPAGLPNLPFRDDQFDLTLSANLLFLYDDRLSEAFHLDAIDELLRVTRGEVRIFPLVGLDRKRSDYLDAVTAHLDDRDAATSFVEVPYELQPNATTALVAEPD